MTQPSSDVEARPRRSASSNAATTRSACAISVAQAFEIAQLEVRRIEGEYARGASRYAERLARVEKLRLVL
jgi:hypothetical protein